jgi:glycosyltransferase involved in cell wall biosynthesis
VEMKILQVSSATSIGGGEIHVIELCQSLLARGHAVHLAVRPQSPLIDRLDSPEVTFYCLPLRNSLDVSSARRMSRIIRHEQIDIVHAHVSRDYLVCAAAQRLAGRGQLVLTRHHYLPVKENWVYRRMFRQAGSVIAVSESVRQGLIASLNLPPDRVVTIPNWVNLDEYRDLPDPQQARAHFNLQTRLAVGMVGQIIPAKGQEEFIRAAARLASWRDDVVFLIVGEEPDKQHRFTKHLRRLASELKLGERLRFVRWVENLPWLFAALTVMVVPSWFEAFSITLIQAMAAGVPVIASGVGGPAEIVTDGVTGLLVPPRRVEALAQAINDLLDDSDLRARLSAAAREEVQRRFEREAVINRIESIYLDLLNPRQGFVIADP